MCIKGIDMKLTSLRGFLADETREEAEGARVMMMFGKAFASMYQGSMVGAGLNVFAVWNYAIALADRGFIELNPKYLAPVLGGTEKEIVAALGYLTRPDPESRTQREDGRRLVQEGKYMYRIVNWEHYQLLKTKVQLREYNRVKQKEYRQRKKSGDVLATPVAVGKKVGGIPSYGERLQTTCLHDTEWLPAVVEGWERCSKCGLERLRVDPEAREVESV